MGARSTAAFRKLKTCPPSEALLHFREETAAGDATRQELASHLSGCDFCGAELQLLSRFPVAGPPQIKPVKMPRALYRLAVDLLAFSTRAVEAACERSSLTLTDA
jgi:hypothetical protein